MATIGEYVNEVMAKTRLPLGAAELAAVYLKNGVDPTESLSLENVSAMDIAFIYIIPDLLLMPDKQTGDTSLKWDRGAVLSWYRLKCAEYGLPDDQAEPPSEINDLSWMH